MPSVPIEHGQITYASTFAEPGRVRRLPVVRLVDGDVVAGALGEARERLVAREPRVAVQLGREHLDRGARDRDADLAVRGGERLQQPPRVRRARGAGDAEKDAHYSAEYGARASAASLLARPWRLRGTSRAASGCASPSPANDGIGEPGLTHAGHLRCATWKAMPLFFAPSAVSSGAPRLLAAVAEVRVAVETAGHREELRARDRLRVAGEALLLRPVRAPSPTSSEPSDSFAVAPLYVRTPIEMTTRIDGDHRDRPAQQPPLGAHVDERHREQQHEQRSSGCRSCRGSPSPAT